jgi:cytochrome c oxidase assembly protein subunit 15
MGGQLVPEGLWLLDPAYRNFFENPVTVQFSHRVLAILTLVAVVVFVFRAGARKIPLRARSAFRCLLGGAFLQVALGISTLILVVPLPIAAAHQAGALLLWTAALWSAAELGQRA